MFPALNCIAGPGIPAIMLIEAILIWRPDMGSKGRKNEKKPKKQAEAKPAEKKSDKPEQKRK
jgi:hypothetical protein